MGSRDELYNDPENALRLALDGRQSMLWTAFPGIVIDVNFTDMTCSIQPAIQGTVEDESGVIESVDMPVLIKVPICFPKAGGFVLTLPLSAGDEVLVVIASRCIDAWWQSGGVQRAMEARMHDLSDGFCIPGPCSVPNVIPAISSSGAQLRNEAGTTYLEISADGKIKLVSPTAIAVTGDLTVSGKVEANGEVTAHKATVPVNLSTHTHTGVTVGSGNTGGPVG